MHYVRLKRDFAVVFIQELNMMTEVCVYHIDRGYHGGSYYISLLKVELCMA